MTIQPGEKKLSNLVEESSDPPGKFKIAEALAALLEEKDSKSTTSAKLANTSNINSVLTYMMQPIIRVAEHLILPGLIFESKLDDDACTGESLSKTTSRNFQEWNC